jgi:hypothetical protein
MSFSTACTCGLGSRRAISRHSAARSLHSLEVIIGYSQTEHQSTTSDRRWLMAKKPTEGRRKLVEFDASNLSAHHCARCDARQFIGDGATGQLYADVGVSGDRDGRNVGRREARADLHGHHRQLHEANSSRLRLSWHDRLSGQHSPVAGNSASQKTAP